MGKTPFKKDQRKEEGSSKRTLGEEPSLLEARQERKMVGGTLILRAGEEYAKNQEADNSSELGPEEKYFRGGLILRSRIDQLE